MDDGGGYHQQPLNSEKIKNVRPPSSNRRKYSKIPVSMNLEDAIKYELEHGRTLDLNPKKFRRTISNRLSACRARIKQSWKIIAMENEIKDLEVKIEVLSFETENQKNYQEKVKSENELLKEKIETCRERSNQSNAIMGERIAEKERLKDIIQQKEIELWMNLG